MRVISPAHTMSYRAYLLDSDNSFRKAQVGHMSMAIPLFGPIGHGISSRG